MSIYREGSRSDPCAMVKATDATSMCLSWRFIRARRAHFLRSYLHSRYTFVSSGPMITKHRYGVLDQLELFKLPDTPNVLTFNQKMRRQSSILSYLDLESFTDMGHTSHSVLNLFFGLHCWRNNH